MPRVRGLGPRDNPCGVRNASKSDLDEDVEIGIIGGVDEDGAASIKRAEVDVPPAGLETNS